jgi:nucleotide-binding universal stress UspA family protein
LTKLKKERMAKEFRILVASDGSPSAREALDTTLVFPWPARARARAVVALGPSRRGLAAETVRALHRSTEDTQRALASRWPQADTVEVHEAPAQAILAEQRRFGADIVVMGWRGHGVFRRLIAGSVSRRVAEAAACSVLVVPSAPSAVRRVLVGFDGSAHARNALRLLGRLVAPRGNRLFLVSVVGPSALPAFFPGHEAKRTRERLRKAQADLLKAAPALEARGWKVTPLAFAGEPLAALLDVVDEHRVDVLVVGARSTGGAARLLLGSVAQSALNLTDVPLLIAR